MKSIVAIIALLSAAVCAENYAQYSIPAVDLTDSSASLSIVQALKQTGIVAFKNVPDFENTRLAYVEAAEKCVATPHSAVMRKLMVDGTTRRTLSTNVDLSTVPENLKTACPDYVTALEKFNALLNKATLQFAQLLDGGAVEKGSNGVLIQEVVEQGKHLEHFHAYTNPESDVNQDDYEHSLEPHTDLGAGLWTSAPVFFNAEHEIISNPDPSTGLYIKVDDAWVQPVLKSDELVFMAGEGWSQWIGTDSQSDLHFPAVVHAMKMPRGASSDIVRAFHGRMLLLSEDMVMQNNNLRFKDFNNRNTRFLKEPLADSSFPSIACASRPRALVSLAASDSSCTVGIYEPGNSSSSNATALCNYHCNAINMPEDTQKCKDLGCKLVSSIPNGGTECWMICIQTYTDAQCPSKNQKCVDQTLTCDGKVLTPAPTTAGTNSSATSTSSPSITTIAPKANSSSASTSIICAMLVFVVGVLSM
ncbi:hypothetical protein THRCLA_04232 [Thraustotheca clavata]|uniref:Secreted protein n=1 Tax=Thraustotheca clavata TaxID=74557 RepID=A0A1V9ZZK0_9STRA|nr:hypothetical protein THRCLA_04232 [Thraustotheca clavata]